MSGESIQLYAGVKLNNMSDGMAGMANREVSMVYLWDIGPGEPVPPKRPKVPKGTEGDPEYDLAMSDFRRDLLGYDEAIIRYGQQKKEYATFMRQMGGPFEEKMWSGDAKDALANDARAVEEGRQAAKRWFLSARTRGYDKLPNGGLPGTLRPGKGHEDNLRREREGNADIDAIKKTDPIFGQLEHAR